MAVNGQGAKQRVVQAQRNCQQAAAAPDLHEPTSVFVAGAIRLRLHNIGHVDDALAFDNARPTGPRIGRLRSSYHQILDVSRIAVRSHEAEGFAVKNGELAARCFTKPHRPLQHCLKHRRKMAGRGIDDLQHLCCRGLPSQRLVALGIARGKLPLQIGYKMIFWIGERALRHRAHLRTSAGPTLRADHTLSAIGHHVIVCRHDPHTSGEPILPGLIGSNSAREHPESAHRRPTRRRGRLSVKCHFCTQSALHGVRLRQRRAPRLPA